jgi:hypothetical protein
MEKGEAQNAILHTPYFPLLSSLEFSVLVVRRCGTTRSHSEHGSETQLRR